MKKYSCFAALSYFLLSPANAGEISIATLGISFKLPDHWTYKTHKEQGAAKILLSPISDDKPNIANRCLITAHDLPDSFRSYTQEQLNSAYASKPITNEFFTEQLSQAAGHRVTVARTGQGMLGKNLAYWATSTSSESIGLTTAFYFSKHYLTQSPKYAWNIHCGTASMTTAADAAKGFNNNAEKFDAFIASLRITD